MCAGPDVQLVQVPPGGTVPADQTWFSISSVPVPSVSRSHAGGSADGRPLPELLHQTGSRGISHTHTHTHTHTHIHTQTQQHTHTHTHTQTHTPTSIHTHTHTHTHIHTHTLALLRIYLRSTLFC